MAVLIKNFGMPSGCFSCPLSAGGWCLPLNYQMAIYQAIAKKKRLPDCPLVFCEQDRAPAVDESLDNIMEEVCEICMYKGDYKDPDDLIRERCNDCKVVERVDKVLYGSTHT